MALCRFQSTPFGFMASPRGQIGTPSSPRVYPLSSADLAPRGFKSMKGVMLFLLHISYTAVASCAESRIKAEIFQSVKNVLMQASPCSMAGSTLQDREDRQSRVGICEEIEVIAVVEEISGRIPAPIGIGL